MQSNAAIQKSKTGHDGWVEWLMFTYKNRKEERDFRRSAWLTNRPGAFFFLQIVPFVQSLTSCAGKKQVREEKIHRKKEKESEKEWKRYIGERERMGEEREREKSRERGKRKLEREWDRENEIEREDHMNLGISHGNSDARRETPGTQAEDFPASPSPYPTAIFFCSTLHFSFPKILSYNVKRKTWCPATHHISSNPTTSRDCVCGQPQASHLRSHKS